MNRLVALTFASITLASASWSARAEDELKPTAVYHIGDELPKCPAKIKSDAPHICLKGGILQTLCIPAHYPLYYAPCFSGGRTCVELTTYGF